MAIKKVALANRWMSVTDVVDRLRRAREYREQQSTLLNSLEGRAKQRRDEVERTLADLSPSQRASIVMRTVSGHRAELKRASLDGRVAYIRSISKLQDEVMSAKAHYQSPVQMLAREGLGSERRSRLIHQIEKSGSVELASLAALAASTGDKELGAALLTRNSGTPINERAFSSQEVADALVGEDGNVHEVQVTSGAPLLAKAAAQAVKQWRYQPFQLNGKPVSIHNQITIQFKLP